MNRIICAIAVLAIATSCTNKPKQAADPHAGHNHGAVSTCPSTQSTADTHSEEQHATDSHAEAEGSPATHADEIIFPVEQAKRVDFAVETITPSTFSEVTKCSGQILAAQGDEVTIAAPVSGIVSFADARMSTGSAVSSGQRLFYINSKNVASGDQTAKSEAAYNKAKNDLERAEKLLADKIVSQKEYDQLKLTYEQALAEYTPLRNSRTGQGTGVAAQISGYVTSLDITSGQYVEVGTPLATISVNRRLQLRADISQKYYDRLGTVRSATFVAPSSERLFDLRTMGGRLVSVGKNSQSTGHMIPVFFEFDNRGGVVAGSFVEVYLIGSPVENTLTVPTTAITEAQGLYYVYVQLDEEGYQKREVTLGASDGNRVRILSGLKSGDKVVTRGAMNVKMAAASGSIPHGHSH